MDTTRRCSVSDCESPVSARGWCSPHYHRWHRTGSPENPTAEQGKGSDENWLPVVGFEGVYEVSDRGKVRSVSRVDPHPRLIHVRRIGKPRQLSEMRNGYLRVTLSHLGRSIQVSVHRVVLEAFVGPCPAGMEACHANGVRNDNHLENLRWDTKLSNAADRTKHGHDWQRGKTHCPSGHPYTGDNLVIESSGARRCKKCKRASDTKYYKQHLKTKAINAIAESRTT